MKRYLKSSSKYVTSSIQVNIGGFSGDKVSFNVKEIEVEQLGSGNNHFYYTVVADDGCIYGWNSYKNHLEFVPKRVSGVVSKVFDYNRQFITEIKSVKVLEHTEVLIDNESVENYSVFKANL